MLLAFSLVAAPALADTSEADRLLDQGVELRRSGKEREALARFKQAYELEPTPRALGQMGLAEKSLRLWVEAERDLRAALASTADPWIEKNRAALAQALEVVESNLASLHVKTNVAGAKLYVNGAFVADLPLDAPLRVSAGAAQIAVSAPGHERAERRETLPARRVTSLTVELSPAPAEEPPLTAAPPLTPAPPPPADEPTPASDPGSSQRTWAYVAGGVGLVALGVGSYFGVRTLSLKSERDDVCPGDRCPTQRGVDLDDQARSAALVSTIGFGVGIAALGTAAALWLTAPRAEVGASVGPGHASASFALSF